MLSHEAELELGDGDSIWDYGGCQARCLRCMDFEGICSEELRPARTDLLY